MQAEGDAQQSEVAGRPGRMVAGQYIFAASLILQAGPRSWGRLATPRRGAAPSGAG